VPLYVGADEPLGTLWIVSEAEGRFDGRHADALADLAGFAGLALRMAADQQKLKDALNAQQLLTREMGHRLKNVLAVVQGLINMAARKSGSASELAQKMSSTIQALSTAQNLVTSMGSQDVTSTATFEDVLRAILAPYAHAKVELRGPVIEIGPTAINVLALVFHELATNAAKYGALSCLTGSITVTWEVVADNLSVAWTETGGPAVDAAPISSGFGTVLAGKSIASLRGSISPTWGPEGLSVCIRVPSTHLLQ